MDVYALSKFLFQYNSQAELRKRFAENPDAALAGFELSDDERTALKNMDFGALYHAGVPALLITPLANATGLGMPRYLEAIRHYETPAAR